jgi:pilus assembly protein CpaF
MGDLDNSYTGLRRRLRERLFAELEGTLNTNSAEEMTMVEQLFGEILADENVVLSRVERARLFEDVIRDMSGYNRK